MFILTAAWFVFAAREDRSEARGTGARSTPRLGTITNKMRDVMCSKREVGGAIHAVAVARTHLLVPSPALLFPCQDLLPVVLCRHVLSIS
jgi:hypothetical protein